jgi:hypothetical protein
VYIKATPQAIWDALTTNDDDAIVRASWGCRRERGPRL